MPPAPSLDVSSEVAAASKALAPAVRRLTKSLKTFSPTELPVGNVADALYDLRQLVKQLNAVTAPFDDVLAPAIKLVEDHFIRTLAVGESSGVQGKKAGFKSRTT